MDVLSPQLAMYLAGAALFGAVVAWLILSQFNKKRSADAAEDWQGKVESGGGSWRVINDLDRLERILSN